MNPATQNLATASNSDEIAWAFKDHFIGKPFNKWDRKVFRSARISHSGLEQVLNPCCGQWMTAVFEAS